MTQCILLCLVTGCIIALIIMLGWKDFWLINKWRAIGLFMAINGLAISLAIPLYNQDVQDKNRRKESEKITERQYEIARKSELEACQALGFKDPDWSKHYDRFTCADENGFVHEIRPPKCNQAARWDCK